MLELWRLGGCGARTGADTMGCVDVAHVLVLWGVGGCGACAGAGTVGGPSSCPLLESSWQPLCCGAARVWVWVLCPFACAGVCRLSQTL